MRVAVSSWTVDGSAKETTPANGNDASLACPDGVMEPAHGPGPRAHSISQRHSHMHHGAVNPPGRFN